MSLVGLEGWESVCVSMSAISRLVPHLMIAGFASDKRVLGGLTRFGNKTHPLLGVNCSYFIRTKRVLGRFIAIKKSNGDRGHPI